MVRVMNKRTYSGDGHYVGRPSPLGNPFTMRGEHERLDVCKRYATWLKAEFDKPGVVHTTVMELYYEYRLTGALTLICWCAPKACHAYVIAGMLDKMIELNIE